jgi:hypothetical protein
LQKFQWEKFGDRFYYFDVNTGKIVGFSSKIALQEIYFSIIYTGQYTFTVDDEKHLGQYISLEHAKKAVEYFWDIQNRTLLEHEAKIY